MSTTAHDQTIAAHYDAQPYDSNAFYYASPTHLRAAAHLYGIEAPPVAKARVLELGCAAGGNLLPFACLYPDSESVGVDLSSVQIEQGKELISRIGIKNLMLSTMSITDITPEFGTFDYIIVHGVFSWVPPEVRDAILRICRDNLSENGMAYISYNCYPGWKSGEVVRDAMLFHNHFAPEGNETRSAADILGFLLEGLADSNPLKSSLIGAVRRLSNHSDYYITHEYLETFNSPCYFVEFADTALQAGLTYVGDAEPRLDMAATYGSHVEESNRLIAAGKNRLMEQQYLDFSVGRSFRKSMLVKSEREDSISSRPQLERLKDLCFAGYFPPIKKPDAPEGERFYMDKAGNEISYSAPAMIAALDALHNAWPRAITGEKLCEIAASVGETNPSVVLTLLFYMNARLYISLGAADMPVSLITETEEKELLPGSEEIMRWRREVAPGIGQFNPWHDNANLDLTEAEWFVTQQLKHTTKLADLRKILIEAWQRGLVVDNEGNNLKGHRNLEAKANLLLKNLIALFERQGLLV